MFHIIVTSHGPMAQGIKDSIAFIMGSDLGIEALCLTEEGIQVFGERADQLTEQFKKEDTLVLTDIIYGSPFNEFARRAPEFKKTFEMIAGVSLPVVIEALTRCQMGQSLEEARAEILAAGTCVSFLDQLSQSERDTDDE